MSPAPRPTIYLDHAATSWPKPAAVSEAMSRFLDESAGNPGRGGHRLSLAAAGTIERLRERLAAMVGAERPERVVLASGATDALNTAVFGVVRAARRGGARARSAGDVPRIVTSVLEHNAVARPINRLERDGDAEVVRIGCDARGRVSAEAIAEACDDQTTLVAVCHASNVTGMIQPVETITRLVRERAPDALVLVDAAQTVGVLPLTMRSLGADLLAFSGHKALRGPTGIGALVIGARAYDADAGIERIEPVRAGGTGTDSDDPFMPRELPHRFECGTPNTVGCAGLLAALGHASPNALAHERGMIALLEAHYRARDRVRLLGGSIDERLGIAAMTVAGMDARDLAAALDASFGIAVRAGLHCAPGTHRALGTHPEGALRISAGPDTSAEDMHRLIGALDALLGE